MKRLIDDIQDCGPEIFYDSTFQTTLEYHIPRLQKHVQTETTPVEAAIGLRYRGDFFGLLTYLKIPPQYHWIVMRCNGYYSPFEYTEETTLVLVPPLKEIDSIQQIYSSSNTMTIG